MTIKEFYEKIVNAEDTKDFVIFRFVIHCEGYDPEYLRWCNSYEDLQDEINEFIKDEYEDLVAWAIKEYGMGDTLVEFGSINFDFLHVDYHGGEPHIAPARVELLVWLPGSEEYSTTFDVDVDFDYMRA